jgi:hypothetical protein
MTAPDAVRVIKLALSTADLDTRLETAWRVLDKARVGGPSSAGGGLPAEIGPVLGEALRGAFAGLAAGSVSRPPSDEKERHTIRRTTRMRILPSEPLPGDGASAPGTSLLLVAAHGGVCPLCGRAKLPSWRDWPLLDGAIQATDRRRSHLAVAF